MADLVLLTKFKTLKEVSLLERHSSLLRIFPTLHTNNSVSVSNVKS